MGMSSALDRLAGKTVFVTGATGGIGGRLVEKLVMEAGARVRVLVRNLTRAPRVARLPVEIVHGDMMDPKVLAAAVGRSDVVVHLAFGAGGDAEQQRLANVEGTRQIMDACLRAGVQRFVYASTCRVYGLVTPDRTLDESSELVTSGDPYTDSKVDAERLVHSYVERHGLAASVLQPTTVYGPFVNAWTQSVISRMTTGCPILVDGGSGTCNAVYVDDVADAAMLAATEDDAVGRSFLINGANPVSWAAFFHRFDDLVGGYSPVSMSADEAVAHYDALERAKRRRGLMSEVTRLLREDKAVRKRVRNSREVAALVDTLKSVLPESVIERRRARKAAREEAAGAATPAALPAPIHPWLPKQVRYFQAKTVFSIDRAQRLLGYAPRFSFEQGMEITEEWAKWAQLTANRRDKSKAA